MLRWLKEAALVRIEPAQAAAEPGAPPWRAAVDAVAAALAAAKGRTASVRFVVSDHFARYLVLAWDAALGSEVEREAYLRHHFESVYGPRAASWRLTFDLDGAAGTRIAVAMDGALVEALCAGAASAGLAVAAIEPYAVAAFNRLRASLPTPDCFFVAAEPGRLTSLFVQGGEPRRAASERGNGALGRELARLLVAEAVDAGIGREASLAICVAEWRGGAPAPEFTRQTDVRALLGGHAAQGVPA